MLYKNQNKHQLILWDLYIMNTYNVSEKIILNGALIITVNDSFEIYHGYHDDMDGYVIDESEYELMIESILLQEMTIGEVYKIISERYYTLRDIDQKIIVNDELWELKGDTIQITFPYVNIGGYPIFTGRKRAKMIKEAFKARKPKAFREIVHDKWAEEAEEA
jgi:hypothetical protein